MVLLNFNALWLAQKTGPTCSTNQMQKPITTFQRAFSRATDILILHVVTLSSESETCSKVLQGFLTAWERAFFKGSIYIYPRLRQMIPWSELVILFVVSLAKRHGLEEKWDTDATFGLWARAPPHHFYKERKLADCSCYKKLERIRLWRLHFHRQSWSSSDVSDTKYLSATETRSAFFFSFFQLLPSKAEEQKTCQCPYQHTKVLSNRVIRRAHDFFTLEWLGSRSLLTF